MKHIKKTIVLDLPSGKFTHFTGLDIIEALILSGGTAYENLNLIQNEDGDLQQYPTPDDTTEETKVTTKKFSLQRPARLRRFMAGFDGDDVTVTIKTFNPDFTDDEKTKEYDDIETGQPRGIPNNMSRCQYFQATVEGADTLDTIAFEVL